MHCGNIPTAAGPVAFRAKHNYHDHSHAVDPSQLNQGDDASVIIPFCHPHETFPMQLHFVLEEMERDGLAHIGSWQLHGRCFVVHDRDEFVRLVLSSYFTQSSFASFQRQLNIYGFKRLTAGPDKGGYYNEFFLKGMPFLVNRIVRISKKNTGCRKPASPESEPDFYRMATVPRVQTDTVVSGVSRNNSVLESLIHPPAPDISCPCIQINAPMDSQQQASPLESQQMRGFMDSRQQMSLLESQQMRGFLGSQQQLNESESLQMRGFNLPDGDTLPEILNVLDSFGSIQELRSAPEGDGGLDTSMWNSSIR